jgi:hypothetical protein
VRAFACTPHSRTALLVVRELKANACPLRSLSFTVYMPQLVFIDVSETAVPLDALTHLPLLEFVNVAMCGVHTADQLVQLTCLTRLTRLVFPENPICDDRSALDVVHTAFKASHEDKCRLIPFWL